MKEEKQKNVRRQKNERRKIYVMREKNYEKRMKCFFKEYMRNTKIQEFPRIVSN